MKFRKKLGQRAKTYRQCQGSVHVYDRDLLSGVQCENKTMYQVGTISFRFIQVLRFSPELVPSDMMISDHNFHNIK